MILLNIRFALLAILCCKTITLNTDDDCFKQCIWEPWSSCTATCGGGSQHRTRSFKPSQESHPFDLLVIADHTCRITCAFLHNFGKEIRLCNAMCFNGTFISTSENFGHCVCQKGSKGVCCEQEVQCGIPSDISHGRYSGNVFTYGRQVVYSCDTNFNMTDPSTATRNCTEDGIWSGSLPRCEYVTSCNSSPCRNGAKCVNILSGYRCVCLNGWTGKDCEIDIQPPVVQNCPEDRVIFTAELTSMQRWKEPELMDPFGNDVHISKNYPDSSFEFPWGVYTVIYEAVKPLNGLSTTCMFNISIKPIPCDDLNVPKHGIVACNTWKKEYARVCKLMCLNGFTYPPGFKSDDWYTCGSSGYWLPSTQLSECLAGDVSYGPAEETTFFPGCDKQMIADFYIRRLKVSQFNDLCEENRDLCKVENVNTTCS